MPELSAFGNDPFWLVCLKTLGVFVILVVLVLVTIWAERRVVARMQMRVGPNRVGPFGLLQSLMDGFKLALKEEIIPVTAHKAVYWLAPLLSAITAFAAFAVIPFGPEVSIFGTMTPLQLTDFPQSVLYVLAIASIGIYGLVLAGWSSGSTYPLLGGLRSSAQMISYEISMGLSFVAVFLYAGSMSTSQIVSSQQSLWFAVLLAPSFVIYVTSMVGETNRAPFDLPEAEGELVGGFHTEYSSLKFAMFFLAEYINMVTVSSIATTLFLAVAGALAAVADPRSEHRLAAHAVVVAQDLPVHLHVHLAAWHVAAFALRPVHGIRLACVDPDLADLDRSGGRSARRARRVRGIDQRFAHRGGNHLGSAPRRGVLWVAASE